MEGQLGQPRDVELFITGLQNTMRETLDALDRGLPRNPSVKIQPNGRIVVSPLEALPEPVHLSGLKDELVVRWPMTRGPSRQDRRVETLELDASVRGGEAPVDARLLDVSIVHPGSYFSNSHR
jgi:hypothetical protein